MATVWVLDTSTKGTGATMVPLEKVLRKPSEHVEPIYAPPPRTQKPPLPEEPRRPRTFKIVDILTRQVPTGGATAQAAIEVLSDVRSIVDVNIYVWQPKQRSGACSASTSGARSGTTATRRGGRPQMLSARRR